MAPLGRALLPGGRVYRCVRHPLWIGWLVFLLVFSQSGPLVGAIDWLFGARLRPPSAYPASFWSAVAVGTGAGLVCLITRARRRRSS